MGGGCTSTRYLVQLYGKLMRKRFAEYLKANADKLFETRNTCKCPLAQFCGHPFIATAKGTWTNDFISSVDRIESKTITGAEALKILESI
jgi:hypothetical protein